MFWVRVVIALALARLFAVTLAACASEGALPPPYGDCNAVGDASCALPEYSSASGGSPVSEASTESSTTLADTGTCGLGLFNLQPANSECLPCISTAAPTGCCQASLACSVDSACTARLVCASLGPQGVSTCASAGDLASAQFLDCLDNNCNPQCADVIAALTGEQ